MITGLSPARFCKCVGWYTFLSFIPFFKAVPPDVQHKEAFNSSAQCRRKYCDICDLVKNIHTETKTNGKMNHLYIRYYFTLEM
jgi:hypothetical protein